MNSQDSLKLGTPTCQTGSLKPLRLLGRLMSEDRELPHEGLQIGRLTGWNENGRPLVVLPGETTGVLVAQTTVPLRQKDVGCPVAILYETGGCPVVIGMIQDLKGPAEVSDPKCGVELVLDGQRLELSAQNEITLRCGDASITLTRAGKIMIRGVYISSCATGQNRIKGATVQIN
jgi:hypothetical protein